MGLFNSVVVPKKLKITNLRLGILLRVLQIGVVAAVCIQIFWASQWNTEVVPVSYGLEMWTNRGPANLHSQNQVAHCTNTQSYQYNYSANYQYLPTDCRQTSEAEAAVKSGLNIFWPIYYASEKFVHEVPHNVCGNLTCSPGETKTDDGVSCKCTSSQSYFVKNPEENLLFMNHGFSVTTITSMGKVEKATTSQTHVQGEEEDKRFEIMTVITMKGDRKTKCKVGGKSVWSKKDSHEGIGGSLKEWMACGGLSLDDLALDSKPAGKTTSPFVRITGIKVDLKLFYTDSHDEEGHEGTVCYIEVQALPLFNSMNSIDYTMLPTATDKSSAYRSRYAMGISFAAETTGNFKFFDYNALLLVITSSIVLLSIPETVIIFIVTYLIGRLSKILTAVSTEEFNLVARFDCICSRLIAYKASFDSITQGAQQISEADLKTNISAVFAEQQSSGQLDAKELDDLSKWMMGQLDEGKTGGIELLEFLRACNSAEPVKIKDLASIFDPDTKGSGLECIFSDVKSQLAKEASKVKVLPAPDEVKGFSAPDPEAADPQGGLRNAGDPQDN